MRRGLIVPVQLGTRTRGQRGMVLLFALIAMVAISLAAIALVRSVDTTTLIAGNLAFRQAATNSGDNGIESAVTWLSTQSVTTLESSNTARGYYNSVNLNAAYDPTKLDAISGLTWEVSGYLVGTDPAGNTVRYIIQRMCTHPAGKATVLDSGTTISTTQANCLFSDSDNDTNTKGGYSYGGGAVTTTSGSPVYRVTAQISGPRNTTSYVQAFVY